MESPDSCKPETDGGGLQTRVVIPTSRIRVAGLADWKPHPNNLIAGGGHKFYTPGLGRPHAAREDDPLLAFRDARPDTHRASRGIGMNIVQDRLIGRADHFQRNEPITTHQQPELREPEALELRARRPHAPELEAPEGSATKPPSEPWVPYDGPMSSTASIAIEQGTSTDAGSLSPPEQPVKTARTTEVSPPTPANPIRVHDLNRASGNPPMERATASIQLVFPASGALSTNVRGFEPARERCHHRPNESNQRSRRLLDRALGE